MPHNRPQLPTWWGNPAIPLVPLKACWRPSLVQLLHLLELLVPSWRRTTMGYRLRCCRGVPKVHCCQHCRAPP